MTTGLRCAFFLFVTSIAIPAQELLWRTTGLSDSAPGGGRKLGTKTEGIGDIDGDGFEDVVTIAGGSCGASFTDYLWLLSGRDGHRIREVLPPTWTLASIFRSIDRAGDFNNDGVPDYVVGIDDQWLTGADRAEVWSGVDDSCLMATAPGYFPDEVLGDIDVDGDGLKDVIVGDEHALGYWGTAHVYSHHGQLLYQLSGTPNANPVIAIAASFAKLGDVDDDGCEDFVMGCYENSARGVSVIVSGRTGTYLRYCYGELPGDVLCYNMDNCGDFDRDGYDDFAVSNSDSAAARGCVRVFSSRSGQVLQSWNYPTLFGTAHVASRGIDLDGDGMPDVVASSRGEVLSPQLRGAVYALSGRDATTIQRFTSQLPFSHIGYWQAILKPPAGERIGLVAIPDQESDWTTTGCFFPRGSISVYRGLPLTARELGAACPGTLASAPHVGMQSLGVAGVRVALSGAPASAPAVLMLGVSTTRIFGVPLPLAIDPLGFPGCQLRTSIEAQHLVVTGNAGQDLGYARLDVPIPVPVSGLGTFSVSGQWVVLGAGTEFPGGLTEAITWRR